MYESASAVKLSSTGLSLISNENAASIEAPTKVSAGNDMLINAELPRMVTPCPTYVNNGVDKTVNAALPTTCSEPTTVVKDGNSNVVLVVGSTTSDPLMKDWTFGFGTTQVVSW